MSENQQDVIESLRQQLADREVEVADLRNDRDTWKARAEFSYRERDKLTKREVMLREFVKLLRDYIPASAVGNMTVQQALAATADLENVRLCKKEPVASVVGDWKGNFAALLEGVPPSTPLYRAWEPK